MTPKPMNGIRELHHKEDIMIKILDETQIDRDKELAQLTNKTLEFISSVGIATPDSIRVYDKTEKPENIVDLYKAYKHLDLIAYFKTLMYTSVTRRHPELFKLLRETKNKKCLDFGSGVGSHSIALAENNNDVTMLDVRESKLIHFAVKRFFNRGLPFDVLYHDDELPDVTYDVVICTDVLEHVPDPIKELYRIRRSMKIGGLLHIQVSTMVKPSSGHFSESIKKWKEDGTSYLDMYFEKENATLYRRIK